MKGYIETINPMEVDYGPGIRVVVVLNIKEFKLELTVNGLVDRIRKFRPYIEPDGGVTFVGDIPLQLDFLIEELKVCHKAGIKTCIDLNNISNIEEIKSLLKYTDCAIYNGKDDCLIKYIRDKKITLFKKEYI